MKMILSYWACRYGHLDTLNSIVGQVVMDLLEFEVSCKNPDRRTEEKEVRGRRTDGGGKLDSKVLINH